MHVHAICQKKSFAKDSPNNHITANLHYDPCIQKADLKDLLLLVKTVTYIEVTAGIQSYKNSRGLLQLDTATRKTVCNLSVIVNNMT